MWHKLCFSYIIDTIISKTTRIPLPFNAANISVFLETNTESQTNSALPVLQLRNIAVVDTLSRCDTVEQFSWTVLFSSCLSCGKSFFYSCPSVKLVSPASYCIFYTASIWHGGLGLGDLYPEYHCVQQDGETEELPIAYNTSFCSHIQPDKFVTE